MKERPILFSGEMVRAILGGRKTQTRRVIKPQPIFTEMDGSEYNPSADGPVRWNQYEPCPYGHAGDRLWVRETFACFDDDWRWPGRPHDLRGGPWKNLYHRADLNEKHPNFKHYSRYWRPSIHMPRWASRITLEITDVRVERLQDISEEDAEAEGVSRAVAGVDEDSSPLKTYRTGFVRAWNAIYGDWLKNPWVWVISFRRLP